MPTIDARATHWMRSGAGLRRMDDALFKEIQRALMRSRVSGGKDYSFAEFLSRSKRYGLSPTGRRFAQTMVEGFDAADPARVSAQSIAEEWRSGGAADSPQFRPAAGYAALMDSLAQRIQDKAQLRLRSVVEQISWQRGRVEVSGKFVGTPFMLTADRAIVTLPLGVLLQGASVIFAPALDSKARALRGLASGPVMKVCMRFSAPLWETLADGKYADASFFHLPGASFPTFWTALPLRAPLMVAWVGGPRAAQLSALSPEAVVAHAISSLQMTLGLKGAPKRRLLDAVEETWYHDWQSDPFARGAYSYILTGGKNARRALAKPIEDTLYFAGEATDATGEAGTVAGALLSGIRAAREITAKR
jgi:monoamine oxidase